MNSSIFSKLISPGSSYAKSIAISQCYKVYKGKPSFEWFRGHKFLKDIKIYFKVEL